MILPSSLSTVFVTWIPGLTLICPCPFTLVRSVARLFMDCISKARQIWKFLSPESRKTLVHVFVTSRLDYCNSLLFGVPKFQTDRFRNVINSSARLILRVPKFDHIPFALFHLYWLPVAYRVHFKLLLLVPKLFTIKAHNTLKNTYNLT